MKNLAETDILDLVAADARMQEILSAVRGLQLNDCWIGAGFVRSKVWDHLHGYASPTPLGDIDVVYFDRSDIDEQTEKVSELQLAQIMPDEPWSVKNQARMHLPADEPPYRSSEHAISLWPETATSIAVRLTESNALELIAPHGIHDLTSLIVRPTPHWMQKLDKYRERIIRKDWQKKWPELTIFYV